MRFPRGFADEVKNQGDIVRVVSDYVTLKKRGANFLARCPFHSEKTPSFTVHQGKGLYKCFGCGAGGGIFDFVMQIEGCSFPEAVRIVAEKNGIPIPAATETEDYKRVERDREVVLRLNASAAEYFEAQLNDASAGRKAREYIESRGITDATCKLFRLGYAPDYWEGLIGFLRSKGASTAEIDTSGLAVLKEQGGLFDRFRGRVMFPIVDSQGRPIAFGGRVMGEGEPKYLNSPETAAYTKGRHLYGLALARNAIRQLGFAILVEGYLDCMIPYQEGVHNIVASLGTALTDKQVQLLRRYMDQPRIVVNFDPDSAGQNATMRSIELLLAEGFRVNVLRMPTDEDPDEFVRAHGVAAFNELFKTTQPYIEYIVDRAIADHDTARPSGKVEAINAILPHLSRMRDKVARAHYAAQIADRLKVDSRLIREELKRVAIDRQPRLDPKRVLAAAESSKAERQLLELMFANREVRQAILSNLKEDDYNELATGPVFSALLAMERTGVEPDFAALSEHVAEGPDRELLSALLMSDLWWTGGDEFDKVFKHATEALFSLRNSRLERRLEAIQIEIGEAVRDDDSDRLKRLCEEKIQVAKRITRPDGREKNRGGER